MTDRRGGVVGMLWVRLPPFRERDPPPDMSAPVAEITRREEFSAAHRLHDPRLSDEENRRLYGPCNNPRGHGHNYVLEVTVRGEIPPNGMVMDLNRLMVLLREEIIPTAENLAVAFWERLAPRLEENPACRLQRIRLYESPSNFVDYYGPTTREPAR